MNKHFLIEDNILFSYTGKEKIIEIPEGIEVINNYCFKNNYNVEKIILPKSCTQIKEAAFKNCENLKEINLNNIKTIEDYAFANCGFKELLLENIKYIGCYCFEDCNSLEKISLNNIKKIDFCVFNECQKLEKISLKNINLMKTIFHTCNSLVNVEIEQDSIKELSGMLFTNCKNLETIKINGIYNESTIRKIIGMYNFKLQNIIGENIICENKVVYNENKTHLIAYLDGKEDKYFKIPDSINKISTYSIHNSYIETLEFGEDISEIKEQGINSNSLKNIIFNKKLEKIYKSGITLYNKDLKNLDLKNTNIKKINVHEINSTFPILIKLPNNIKEITGYSNSIELEVKNKKNVYIDTNCKIIERDKTLEELIEDGKSFREASQIIKEQER